MDWWVTYVLVIYSHSAWIEIEFKYSGMIIAGGEEPSDSHCSFFYSYFSNLFINIFLIFFPSASRKVNAEK